MDDQNLSTQVLFARIFLPDFQPEDLCWLVRLDKIGSDKATAGELLKSVSDGQLAAWRISGGASGIMLTSLLNDALVVNGLASHGLIRCGESFYNRLQEMRQKAGKARILGEVARPGLIRLYSRVGFKPIAQIMELA